MRFLRIIVILLIIVLFAIIYTQNTEVFTHEFELKMDLKNYLVGPYITNNVVIILSSFVVGAILSLLMGAFQSAAGKGAMKSRIKKLESELSEAKQAVAVAPSAQQSTESTQSESSDSPFSP